MPVCLPLCQSVCHRYLPYLLAFFLTFYLLYLRWFFVIQVRLRTLWSGASSSGPARTTAVCCLGPALRSSACSWGPAGTTLILGFLFGCGGDHCDHELAVEVRRGHSDPGLAVRVRLGPLRSSACSWGPAGTTLILSFLFGSGGDHCNHELGVEVRRRRRRPADMKSNNPHLTGGQKCWQYCFGLVPPINQHGWPPPILKHPSGKSNFLWWSESNLLSNLVLMFLTWWFWCWLQRDAKYKWFRKGDVWCRVNEGDAL